MVLQFLCAVHILAGLRANHLLRPGVFLPFQGQHEQLQCGVVQLVGLLVFALIVVLDRLLDRVNRPPQKIRVTHVDNRCVLCSFVMPRSGKSTAELAKRGEGEKQGIGGSEAAA